MTFVSCGRLKTNSLITACFCAFLGLGCHQRPTDGPEKAVQNLLQYLRTGRWDRAWALLSGEDQKRLLEHHRRLAQARDLPPTNSPRDAIIDAQLLILGEPENFSLASRPGEDVRVRVTMRTGSGATFNVTRDENKLWRVHVFRSIEPLRANTEPQTTTSTTS